MGRDCLLRPGDGTFYAHAPLDINVDDVVAIANMGSDALVDDPRYDHGGMLLFQNNLMILI